jgi:hypothetical protein
MNPQDEISLFQDAVDARFGFLSALGFQVDDRESIGDRYGSVRFRSSGVVFEIGWDAYDGDIEAKLNGRNVWDMLVERGLWQRSGYQAAEVSGMKRGLDRLAAFLSSQPQVLRDVSQNN